MPKFLLGLLKKLNFDSDCAFQIVKAAVTTAEESIGKLSDIEEEIRENTEKIQKAMDDIERLRISYAKNGNPEAVAKLDAAKEQYQELLLEIAADCFDMSLSLHNQASAIAKIGRGRNNRIVHVASL